MPYDICVICCTEWMEILKGIRLGCMVWETELGCRKDCWILTMVVWTCVEAGKETDEAD
jgi:hypothetical protein